ncbi:MAG: RNA-binding protein [Ignavibacteria bacterium]|nr:RNA-binding protein [Ignavibacteria bacterium]
MNIYVKNLPLQITNDDLRKLFEAYGNVVSVEIITNIRTGEAKDYGFVVMGSEEEAMNAISSLDGKEWIGKIIHLEKGRNRGRRGHRETKRPFSHRGR